MAGPIAKGSYSPGANIPIAPHLVDPLDVSDVLQGVVVTQRRRGRRLAWYLSFTYIIYVSVKKFNRFTD